MLGRKNSLACRDRELPIEEELDGHTFPTNAGVVGDAWGILAPTNSFALLSTRAFSKKAPPRPSNLGEEEGRGWLKQGAGVARNIPQKKMAKILKPRNLETRHYDFFYTHGGEYYCI